MMELTTSGRAAAEYMPTGPTVSQIKERANKAGTEGPPPTAPTRADQADQPRDTSRHDTLRPENPVARQVIEDQMHRQDAAEGQPDAQRQSAMLAKVAFEQTQVITRDADAMRAETMRIAM